MPIRIDNETFRALTAEATLNTKIDTETTRATAAEALLDTKISTETARAIAANDVDTVLQVVSDLVESGQDLQNFCRRLLAHIRNLMVLRAGVSDPGVLGVPESLIALERQLDARFRFQAHELSISVPLGKLTREDMAAIEAQLLANGYRFEPSAMSSAAERPEAYKDSGLHAADFCFEHPNAPTAAADAQGRELRGVGDNVVGDEEQVDARRAAGRDGRARIHERRPFGDHFAAVDLDQSPGDIVVLSAADSEIALLAGAQRGLAQRAGWPSLRLANLGRLKHNLSVDLYVDKVVAKARLVVARLLGGRGYWTYAVDQIVTACQRHARGAQG